VRVGAVRLIGRAPATSRCGRLAHSRRAGAETSARVGSAVEAPVDSPTAGELWA